MLYVSHTILSSTCTLFYLIQDKVFFFPQDSFLNFSVLMLPMRKMKWKEVVACLGAIASMMRELTCELR